MPGENSSFIDEQERLRLLTALRESEILRELGELLASSLDLNRILQVLVRRTTEVCEVERCAVWLLDEQRGMFVPATYHISSQQLDSQTVKNAGHIWHSSTLPLDDPTMRRLLDEKGMLFLEDLHGEASMRFVADTFLVRSVLLLALVRDGQPVGLMSLDNPDQVRTFSPQQIQLARAIAQQAAIAIGNGRLYQQAQMERRRAEQLIKRAQATNEVAMAVNTGEDLADVLAIALDHLVQGLDASGGAIVLLEGETPVVVSRKHLKGDSEHSQDVPAGITLSDLPHCQQAALSGTPLFFDVERIEGTEHEWYRSLGLAHTMIIPLMAGIMRKNTETTREERRSQPYCLGFAIAHYTHTNHQPAPGQVAFAQDIATQCALAIEKHRLLEDSNVAAALAMERANTLDAVFQSLTEGITVITQDGEVLIRNNAASYFLGVPLNSVDTLHGFLQRFPTFTLHGEPIAEEDFPVARALRGERIRGERFITYRANGTQRVIEVNVTPMFDSAKQQIGVVSAFRDITAHMHAEVHIQRALETMLHVAEAVSGITDIHDILRSVLQLTLSTLNCEHGGVYMYDATQQRFTPLLSVGFLPEVELQWLNEQSRWLTDNGTELQPLKELLMQGHATLLNAEQLRSKAEHLPKLFRRTMILAAPITHSDRLLGLMLLDRPPTFKEQDDQESEFTMWDMAIVEGISQLAGLAIKQARLQEEATNARANEAAMREANALKDDFLSITAHEFRTPLTVILAHSQLLLRSLRRTGELGKKDSMGDSLSIIEEQAHLLTNIVNTFLEVTQINRGQLELKVEPVDMAEIAIQVVTNYSTTSPDHLVSCEIEPCTYDYVVMGDSARLFQVLVNLVQNAIKYSPLGGPVTVRLRQRITSGYTENSAAEIKATMGKNAGEIQAASYALQARRSIEVSVEDRGMGIPKDAQARLFERFYRAPNTQSSKVKGIGLGLYLVAELLRMHGGTIRVESSGILGEGSCFIFALPALERDDTTGE